MKKTIFIILFLVNCLQADYFDDALKAYKSGDKQKASKLFEKSCDGGVSDGCYSLGLMYSNGDGVRQDKQKESKLYAKACDGDISDGCSILGHMYFEGVGVRQNKQKAIKLYTKACDGGGSSGCSNLGTMYSKGDGVRQDKQKAIKLYETKAQPKILVSSQYRKFF